MPEETTSVLRTFRLDKATIIELTQFLQQHPEVGSLNHLVNVALKEFAALHKNDKTWLKMTEK